MVDVLKSVLETSGPAVNAPYGSNPLLCNEGIVETEGLDVLVASPAELGEKGEESAEEVPDAMDPDWEAGEIELSALALVDTGDASDELKVDVVDANVAEVYAKAEEPEFAVASVVMAGEVIEDVVSANVEIGSAELPEPSLAATGDEATDPEEPATAEATDVVSEVSAEAPLVAAGGDP